MSADRTVPKCGMCGRSKMCPPNTGPYAMPICINCDRVPRAVWTRSDTSAAWWTNPTKGNP